MVAKLTITYNKCHEIKIYKPQASGVSSEPSPQSSRESQTDLK